MTMTVIRHHKGNPTLFLDDRLMSPVTAYVGSRYCQTFVDAGIELYTFTVPGIWWTGPGRYDFKEVDTYLADYVTKIPGRYIMPRISLQRQGFPWWGQAHPDEMNVLRDVTTGEIRDQLISDPNVVHYLGHEVRLEGINLHSFHSQVWREQAGQAVAALISHCESAPYADQIWAWHLCDGLFQEWFHWNEYAFGALADYSPAAQTDFVRWLKRTYDNSEEQLSQAWGRSVTWETLRIPDPQARYPQTKSEFYDPVIDRPTIDYLQCFSDATVDCITALCRSAKMALPQPKVICAFYGYQFSDMPRPQLNAHYALNRLLASPYVDLIASPHSYSNRGEGGYHSPQAVADSIRRAGKLHFDEIDCKTVWTPDSVTWKRHISQPGTVEATIEMMKKDAAFQMASASAQWWMDLTNQGWFDAPEVVEPIKRLKQIEELLLGKERKSFGEVAFVVSQRSMMFHKPSAGLHNATLLIYRNWHLSRMGAPFEQLQLEDLFREDIPHYKLYIMANVFYLSKAERDKLNAVVKRNGATILWIYAPGYLDDRSASLQNMHALTGIRFGMTDITAELNVKVTDTHHAITQDLPPGFRYGSGVNREVYMEPPRIEYMPNTAVNPAFYSADADAQVLGMAESTQKPGLVVKDFKDWCSIYSSAPLLPWQLMRNIARFAGVHIYDDQGDMIWANNVFLALYAQNAGPRTLRFAHPVTVTDLYENQRLGTQVNRLKLTMQRWETKLLLME